MDEIEIITLKENVKSFCSQFFILSSRFYDELDNCDSIIKIKNLIRFYRDEIYESIGGEDIYELKDEISGLKDELSDLNKDIIELKDELDDLKFLINRNHSSLDEEYKEKFFGQYRDLYTPWELEELLINGRNFLNRKNNEKHI